MKLIIRYYRILNADNEVIYVGVTKNTVEHRFKQHLSWKKHADQTCRVEEIKSIDIGDIRSIEEYRVKRDIVSQIEKDLIKEYKAKGCELTNVSKGGEILCGVYNNLCKEYYLKKNKTIIGFEEYKRKRNRYKQWLNNWIKNDTENPTKRWLKNWIIVDTTNPAKTWLKQWIANDTINPIKRWLKNWISHKVENPIKSWLIRWIRYDIENPTKAWLHHWINYRADNLTKRWLRNWISVKSKNSTKKMLQTWIHHATENPTKIWLHSWIYNKSK